MMKQLRSSEQANKIQNSECKMQNFGSPADLIIIEYE